MDPRDYIVELSGASATPASAPAAPKRPWIAVHWKCCHAYARLYRNKDATAYEGRCPRCGAFTRARIGAGGTSSRFFVAE